MIERVEGVTEGRAGQLTQFVLDRSVEHLLIDGDTFFSNLGSNGANQGLADLAGLGQLLHNNSEPSSRRPRSEAERLTYC
jgi:hypothetical protein